MAKVALGQPLNQLLNCGVNTSVQFTQIRTLSFLRGGVSVTFGLCAEPLGVSWDTLRVVEALAEQCVDARDRHHVHYGQLWRSNVGKKVATCASTKL